MKINWIVTTALTLSVLYSATTVATSDVLLSDTKTFLHNKSSGGSGLDSVTLKAPKISGNSCAVFKKATIKYTKRHYGKVEIVQNPKPQCNPKKEQCKISVSWKHSPAGRLNYQIKVAWALKPC